LLLGVELVEARGGEVLDRLDAAELAPDLVGGLVDLADRLRHGRLRRGILDRVEKSMHAAADDAGHARSDRVNHVSPPSPWGFERQSPLFREGGAHASRSRADYNMRRRGSPPAATKMPTAGSSAAPRSPRSRSRVAWDRRRARARTAASP